MAIRSTCPKCESISFEAVPEKNVANADIWLTFIRCSACGTVVGVIPYHNAELNLIRIEEKLESIEGKLNSCVSILDNIARRLLKS